MSNNLRTRLQKLVDELPTKSPRNPEGGFLPPDPDALAAFHNLIFETARHLFGIDEDDSSCVIVDMTDRSRYEKVHALPVPREIEESPCHPYGKDKWGTRGIRPTKHTPEEEETRRKAILENRRERLRMTLGNFNMAHSKLEMLGNLIVDEYEHEIARPAQERAARIKELERIREIWTNPEGWASCRRGLFYDPASVPPSIRDVRIVGENLKKPILKPDNYDRLMEELERLKSYVEPPPLEF